MTTMRRQPSRSLKQTIPIVANVRLRTLHKGRVVDQYRGHNIFLNVGRDWLIQQISLGAYPVAAGDPIPDPRVAPSLDRRVAFMGLGCGGREQSNPADQAWVIANVDGAATFLQDDTDVTKTGLEVPALISTPPDVYAKPIQSVTYSAPVGLPPFRVWVKYTALWTVGEINNAYGGADVPITEAAMYPYIDDGAGNFKQLTVGDMKIASSSYENFRPVVKAVDYELEVQWTYRV